MRHGKKVNHLGRKKAHRKALLQNLSIALIQYKRINTTLAKAKALRKFVEPIITKGKLNTTHSRRVVFSYLQNKEIVKSLFSDVAEKIGDRPGGYTRIIKTGFRRSDGAEMAMIELVDYNEVMLNAPKKASGSSTKKKRTRRGKKKADAAASAATVAVADEMVSDKAVSEEE